MNPTNVVLASVLKPVDDVRLYRKISCSLAKSYPTHQFHLIGFDTVSLPGNAPPNIHFHPIFRFHRLSLKRLGVGIRFLSKLWKLKPTVVVVATFELLLPAVVYSWFRKTRIVYDVQENYASNIRYTQVFPAFIRRGLAFLVRSVERITHYRIRQYFFAEACYPQEMPFMQDKGIVVANKMFKTVLNDEHLPFQKQKGLLVYSGTISRDYGVFRAIRWVVQLHQTQPSIQLIIIGHCPQQQDWETLQKLATQHNFITLKGGRQPIPHAQILKVLQQAEFALLPYMINQSVQQRIPTKFYECAALQLPMLVQHNQYWQPFLEKYPAGMLVDFDSLDQVAALWQKAHQIQFYQQPPKDEEIYWEAEESKLLKAWEKIIS